MEIYPNGKEHGDEDAAKDEIGVVWDASWRGAEYRRALRGTRAGLCTWSCHGRWFGRGLERRVTGRVVDL